MYAVGAGGADVALAMTGEPVEMAMPEVWGVELADELPDWVSAKDVILEELALELSPRQRDLLQAVGLIDWLRRRDGEESAGRTTKKTGTRNE